MIFGFDQNQFWIDFKSYDVMKSYTNALQPHEKMYSVKVSAELSLFPELK
jgi:hypothetical protein